MKKYINKSMILLIISTLFGGFQSVLAAETSQNIASYQFQSADFSNYKNFKTKYTNLNLVLNKCSSVDSDLTSEKQYRCLHKMNTELTNANSLLYSKLDKFDKSDYSTGIDIGFKKAMQGCDNAYPTNLQSRFKNQILSCKLRLQIERLNFIAFRSLPNSSN